MRKLLPIREFLTSPQICWHGRSYGRIILEPLESGELAVFQELTGRLTSPAEPVREFFAVMGRRAGKSRAVVALAAYTASCIDYRHVLAPGRLASCRLLHRARTRRGRFSTMCGAFSGLVETIGADTARLSSRVEATISAASFPNLRGGTSIGVIADELAFWPSDEGSRNPDSEILAAIRPSMLTTNAPAIVSEAAKFAKASADAIAQATGTQ